MPDLSEAARILSLSILGIWFLLSLVRQIDHPKVTQPLLGIDPFHLIPAWRLFNRAPLDCRLWIRDRDPHGEAGAWQPLAHASSPTLVFWNPGFRRAASRHILVMGLARHLTRRPDWCASAAPWGQMSPFYAALENHLRNLPAEPGRSERQFAITFGPAAPGKAASEAFYASPYFAVVTSVGPGADPTGDAEADGGRA